MYPVSVHASILSTFADKVKAVFVATAEADTVPDVTSQTMDLIKPNVVDDSGLDGEDSFSSTSQDVLSAVSGPLRISTEDIDFPTSDTISVYEVKQGDTIEGVAKLFGVSVNTIMWANNLKSKKLTKGDTIVILPITGIKHMVKKGDTVSSIAKKYKADTQDIATYNGISEDATLALGDTVIVPDGEIEVIQQPKPKTKSSGKSKLLNTYVYTAPSGFLARPLVGGRKSQSLHGHNGVDIAGTPGTPILAAATGRVIVAKSSGYNGGYGSMVIIAHDRGIQTVYGHLRAVYVTQGQSVAQGEQIGELGNTGRSTGPHLHFEVRGAKNPF